MISVTYRYSAAAEDGTPRSGEISARGDSEAKAALAAQGLYVLKLQAQSRRARVQTISLRDQALGLRALASLLKAGMPMSRVLRVLPEVAPASWSPICVAFGQQLRTGTGLATALDDSGLKLAPQILELVRAGEATGSLQQGFELAATELEERLATRAALQNALAYPALLAAATVCVTLLLTVVVLPRFAATLSDVGVTLPPLTRILLQLTAGMRVAALPMLVAVTVGLVLWRSWRSTSKGLEQWHAFLLSAPAVGVVRFALTSARFCKSLSALLGSGAPIGLSLSRAASATGNLCIVNRARRAQQQLQRGESLERALRANYCVPESTLRLIRAGEESGDVIGMLAFAGRLEEERAARALRGVIGMLEPLLIVALGGVVAIVAGALLQALYAMRPTT